MVTVRHDYLLSQLDVLEAESIHVMREVAAEFERPVLLFSGGKDSVVMLALAERAFAPARIPFPVMHVDTGHNFPEVIEFRDRRVAEAGARLVVASVQDSIDAGRVSEQTGRWASRNRLQTTTLLDAINEHRFDAVFGGARRDEEKARAKERVFSFRDEFGQWDPKNQRPELWNLLNGRVRPGESIRVFPLSNWTEIDVWSYIHVESIPVVPLYFAKEREVVVRGDALISLEQPFVPLLPGEKPERIMCRMRSLGCSPCTGAIRSTADTVPKIIEELIAARNSERQLRIIDHDQDGSMELKKREGYF
jgi:sulfate adenylyltransferase subunit 2